MEAEREACQSALSPSCTTGPLTLERYCPCFEPASSEKALLAFVRHFFRSIPLTFLAHNKHRGSRAVAPCSIAEKEFRRRAAEKKSSSALVENRPDRAAIKHERLDRLFQPCATRYSGLSPSSARASA